MIDRRSPSRMLKKAVSKAAASEEASRTLQYVEPLSDARTTLQTFFSILLKDFSILTRVHPRLIGKTERGTVGIAGVVEIDSVVSADGFHRRFEGNGLGVEVAWRMRAAGQGANDLSLRVLDIGHDVDVRNGVVP